MVFSIQEYCPNCNHALGVDQPERCPACKSLLNMHFQSERLVMTAFIECPQCPEILAPLELVCKCGWEQWTEERYLQNGMFGRLRKRFTKTERVFTDEELYTYARARRYNSTTFASKLDEHLTKDVRNAFTTHWHAWRVLGPSGDALAILKPPALLHAKEFIEAVKNLKSVLWFPHLDFVTLYNEEVEKLYKDVIKNLSPEQITNLKYMMTNNLVVILTAKVEAHKFATFKEEMRKLRAVWTEDVAHAANDSFNREFDLTLHCSDDIPAAEREIEALSPAIKRAHRWNEEEDSLEFFEDPFNASIPCIWLVSRRKIDLRKTLHPDRTIEFLKNRNNEK